MLDWSALGAGVFVVETHPERVGAVGGRGGGGGG